MKTIHKYPLLTIEERLQSATMLTDEARDRVRKLWEHLVEAGEQEILDHCLFYEGFRQGNDLVHKQLKEARNMFIITNEQANQLTDINKELEYQNNKLKQDVEYWKNKYYRS